MRATDVDVEGLKGGEAFVEVGDDVVKGFKADC